MIMSGTIRENITFCNHDIGEEEIRKAAEIACIWDYIETLPQGLETVLTERGEGLSEGQVQRIAIGPSNIKRCADFVVRRVYVIPG